MDLKEAQARILALCKLAAQRSEDFSHADYDELTVLADYLGSALPKKFQDILSKGFSPTNNNKRVMGERLLRVIEVHGNLPKRPNSQDDASSENGLFPTFELGKKDKSRVLELCSDMRKIIFASIDFDEPHKKRLLDRIAAIEKQVHSPKGLFDVVLGGVSDLGETLGKFGKDIEPLTKRMNEVHKITRRSTKEYEQLPSPDEIKGLPAPECQSEGDDEPG